MTTEQVLFCLLRYEICGVALPTENFSYDPDALYRLAKHHDMAHLVADALSKNGILPENENLKNAFERAHMLAVYREIQMRAVMQKIREIFCREKIQFVPLKGEVIRSLYPKPWMRTSCDIDILIHEEDLKKAEQALTEAGFTTDGKRDYHDISFFFGGVQLELHFHIRENIEQVDSLLSEVWKNVAEKSDMEFLETPEFYLFHHIAHMAYHFLAGGCGIKPFLDLWLLRKSGDYSDEKIMSLIRKCDLVPFYLSVNHLTDVWLEGKEHTELTRQMESYILLGGVYGISGNSNAVGAVRRKGKFRYLWSVAFPSLEMMRFLYPRLRKYPILLPFYYVHRFFSKLFGKNRKRVRARWKSAMDQNPDQIQFAEALLQAVGLK